MESCWFDTCDKNNTSKREQGKWKLSDQKPKWIQFLFCYVFTCNILCPSLGCCLSLVAILAFPHLTHYNVNCASLLDPAVLIRSDLRLSSIRLYSVEDFLRNSWAQPHVQWPHSHFLWVAWILARNYVDFDEWVLSSLEDIKKNGKEN